MATLRTSSFRAMAAATAFLTVIAVPMIVSAPASSDPAGEVTLFADLGPAPSLVTGADGNLWFTDNFGIGVANADGVLIARYRDDFPPYAGTHSAVLGPDGNVWFAESGANPTLPLLRRVGKITPQGRVTTYETGVSNDASPGEIIAGPDGNMWFTEPIGNRLAKITMDGQITEYPTGIPQGYPSYLTVGTDGNIWFLANPGGPTVDEPDLAMMTLDGKVTQVRVAGLNPRASHYGLTTGPDGNLWLTENDKVLRITLDGQATAFSAGIGHNFLRIAPGPDGNLWATDDASIPLDGPFVVRITPGGVMTKFGVSTPPNTALLGITVGPDGNMWFGSNVGLGKVGTGVAPATPMNLQPSFPG